MRSALVSQQQRIALGVVPCPGGSFEDLHRTPVGVLTVARGNAFRHDRAARVLPDVDHLGAGVGLLVVVRQRHGIELADGVIALQNAAWILPGDRRTGFHLRPRNLGIVAQTLPALGDEIINATFALLVPRVPVLHRGILDLRIVQSAPVPPPQREVGSHPAWVRYSLPGS